MRKALAFFALVFVLANVLGGCSSFSAYTPKPGDPLLEIERLRYVTIADPRDPMWVDRYVGHLHNKLRTAAVTFRVDCPVQVFNVTVPPRQTYSFLVDEEPLAGAKGDAASGSAGGVSCTVENPDGEPAR